MNTRLRSMIAAAVFAWVIGGVPAEAQNVKVDTQQSKLLLDASSTATLQKDLVQAGALGFHAVMATTRGTGEIVLLLERNIKTPQKLEYLLIATNTTGTFRKEISEAAQLVAEQVGSTRWSIACSPRSATAMSSTSRHTPPKGSRTSSGASTTRTT